MLSKPRQINSKTVVLTNIEHKPYRKIHNCTKRRAIALKMQKQLFFRHLACIFLGKESYFTSILGLHYFKNDLI